MLLILYSDKISYVCCLYAAWKIDKIFMMYGISRKCNLMRFTNLLLTSQIISDKHHVFDDMTFSINFFSLICYPYTFVLGILFPLGSRYSIEKVKGKAKTLTTV